ncbi:MAG: SpoIID/LytB domain-containing protein [Deltaproteobacteria bacterium]|nr:SpoIID/LytB domain-containing protein [Deltaproteobacteria bacterium]
MTKTRSLLIALTAFCAASAASPSYGAVSGGSIRVLVLKGAAVVSVAGAEEPPAEIRVKDGGVSVNGKKEGAPLRFSPKEEFLYVNGRPYRGTVEVTAEGPGLQVVNELRLESYLVGIINNEISSRWPVEAVKTQAVVARTYAFHQMNNHPDSSYDIEGTVMGQVYSGAAAEDPAAAKAVADTAGEILTFAGEPALTVYHSNAGGMTDSSKEIWAEYYPYLLPVTSVFDKDAPRFAWEFIVPASSLKELLTRAGYGIGPAREIKCDELTAAGRVKSLVISDSSGNGVRLRGEDLRKIIGYSYLRSALFRVEKKGELFVFTGRGSGHGVGMSQWGAKGMAENGFSYREILEHFYPGTVLRKAY